MYYRYTAGSLSVVFLSPILSIYLLFTSFHIFCSSLIEQNNINKNHHRWYKHILLSPNLSYREPIEEIHSCCFHRSSFSLHTYRVYLSTHIYIHSFYQSYLSICFYTSHLSIWLSSTYYLSINHIIMYLSSCVASSITN